MYQTLLHRVYEMSESVMIQAQRGECSAARGTRFNATGDSGPSFLMT